MKATIRKLIAIVLVILMSAQICNISAMASAPYISGDELILRAPEGYAVKTQYTLENYDGDVLWSAGDAPSGIEMKSDGGLVVPGGSGGGTFEVTASDSNGNVIASTGVTVMDKLYNWADNSERVYLDFEEQTVGEAPSDRVIGTANWNDYVMRFGKGNRTNEPFAVVKEENGSKYISSAGASSWYNNGSSFVTDLISVSDDTKNALANAGTVTIEADFKAESDVLEAYNPKNTFWSVMTVIPNGKTDSVFDLRYQPEGDGSVSIHSFMNSSGVGNQTSSQGKIATVEADVWFKLRLEISVDKGTFDLYVDNQKLIEGVKHSMTDFACKFYIGMAVDNIAVYTGKLLLPKMPESKADTLYFTGCRTEAVLELDNSVYLGDYAYENQVSYSGKGISIYKNKLFVPEGEDDVIIQATDAMFGMDDELIFSRKKGLELTFDSGEDAVLSGGGAVADGVLDVRAGRADFDLMGSYGKMLLTLDALEATSNALASIKMSGSSKPVEILLPPVAGEWTEVLVVLDTANGFYTALCGGELVAEGEFDEGTAETLTLEGALFDNLVYSSLNAVKPYALCPEILGTKAVGQMLTAGYSYYSPWGASMESADVKWYVSDEADGEYVKMGEGESFKPDSSCTGKYLRFEITVNDGKFESEKAVSEAVYINDSYVIDISDSKFSMKISDCFDSRDIYALVSLYENKELKQTIVEKVNFESDVYTWSFDIQGFDGASAMLVFADTLAAASYEKTAGNVPDILSDEPADCDGVYFEGGRLCISGINDTIAVYVYGHSTDENDITVSYSDVYSRDEAWDTSSGGNGLVFASVAYAKNDTGVVINLPELSAGSYMADVVLTDGRSESFFFMVSPEKVLTAGAMSMPGFKNVIRLYAGTDAEGVDSIHSCYLGLNDISKAKVSELLTKSGAGVTGFTTATLLAAYLENDISDDEYSTLCTGLEALSLNISGIELMQYDADRAETGAVIMSKAWTSLDGVLESCFENAILYGIHHVKNFKEADVYLTALDDTKYPSSKYKSEICKEVAGKLYSSLPELKKAIDSFKPASSGGTGGSGGGGGSSYKPSVVSPYGGSVSVSPTQNPQIVQTYTDVPPEHWAAEAITYLGEKGIVNGFPDGSFAPDANITRAEFTKIVCIAFDIPMGEGEEFSDVGANSWYADYVERASAHGIIKGYDGKFMPDSFIKREDASLILFRILEKQIAFNDEYDTGFTDYDYISSYAKDAVMKLYEAGFISGMADGSFCPAMNMTRAQCAQLVANALRR